MEATTSTVEFALRVGTVRVTFSPPLTVEQRNTLNELAQQYVTAAGFADRISKLAAQWGVKADVRAL